MNPSEKLFCVEMEISEDLLAKIGISEYYLKLKPSIALNLYQP
jgi:hypothetical protein